MDEPEQREAGRLDPGAMGTLGLVFVVFVLGVVAGIPLALFGTDVLVAYAGHVFAFLFVLFLIAVLVAGLVALFRRRIWRALFGRAEVEMARFARPLADVAQHAAEQNVRQATSAARDLAELAFARYAWLSTRRWLLATVTALIAAIAALAGSALLLQQNQLLRVQGDLMAEQTQRLTDQSRMLETQIQIGEAQRSASIVPEILAIGAAIGEAGARMPSVVSEVGASMLAPELRARIVAATMAVRPYRYLAYGLDRLTDDELVAEAMARRDDLGVTREQMRSIVAERDQRWGLAGADPRAAAGELTDRAVSPERGHLLSTLHHGGLRDLGQLTFEGADFSFAEVRASDLDGIRLHFAQLRFADFSRMSLREATFEAAQLDHARFVRARIEQGRFASLPNDTVPAPFGPHPILDYQPTRLVGTDFSLAEIASSDFVAVQAIATRFDGAALFDTRFSGALLLASTFRNAILYRVDFTGADLTKTDFDGAVVFEPDFLAQVEGAAIQGTFAAADYAIEQLADQAMAGHPNLNALLRLPDDVQNNQPPLRLKRVRPVEPEPAAQAE